MFENIAMKTEDHHHPNHYKMEIATPKSEEKARRNAKPPGAYAIPSTAQEETGIVYVCSVRDWGECVGVERRSSICGRTRRNACVVLSRVRAFTEKERDARKMIRKSRQEMSGRAEIIVAPRTRH